MSFVGANNQKFAPDNIFGTRCPAGYPKSNIIVPKTPDFMLGKPFFEHTVSTEISPEISKT